MKKTISFLTLFAALALSQPVPVDDYKPTPIVIEPNDPLGFGYAEKIFDARLTNAGTSRDTVIGNVFDIRKLALTRHYRADSVASAAVMDSLIGQMTVSCVDSADSAAVTDSVAFVLTLQGSDFASNNSDPGKPNSDAWYTVRTHTLLGAPSGTAQVTVDTLKTYLPVATHNTQFVRLYGSNLSTVAQNDMRCRVFLHRYRWHPN